MNEWTFSIPSEPNSCSLLEKSEYPWIVEMWLHLVDTLGYAWNLNTFPLTWTVTSLLLVPTSPSCTGAILVYWVEQHRPAGERSLSGSLKWAIWDRYCQGMEGARYMKWLRADEVKEHWSRTPDPGTSLLCDLGWPDHFLWALVLSSHSSVPPYPWVQSSPCGDHHAYSIALD